MKPIYVDSSDYSGPIHACIAFSPDGHQLVGSAVNMEWLTRLGILVGHLYVWDYEKPKLETKPVQ